ncbi:MAG: transcriptional regulator [Peptococcaceae bacterium]|jgi:GntR family transcriptional repressor for pyruvate dehydrogenase complex|nr:transcriptional regulator [Peptococcaceae bacterium]
MGYFTPVSENASLTEKVFKQIRESITSGHFKPGDKLPSENELAESFQVSRTSVREAMKLLAGQGLIVIKRGLGAFVAEHKESPYLSDLQNILLKERENLLELFQIRKILETEAAAWAALNVTAEDIKVMRELIEQAEEEGKKPLVDKTRLNKINSEFHYALVHSTRNKTLVKVMTTLIDNLRESRDITLLLPGRVHASIENHKAILKAIEEGDSEKARQLMKEHLEVVENTIKNMKEQEED